MSATDPDNSATPAPDADAPPSADPVSDAAATSQPPVAAEASSPAVPTMDDMNAAVQAVAAASAAASVPLDLPEFSGRAPVPRSDQAIDLLNDVELNVKIELGRANMLIEDVLRLGQGSVVELDKLAGDPVDVLVNDRLVVRGEVLVLNDNFCVRISEIVSGVEEEVVEADAA